MSIADRIKAVRKQLNMNQTEFSKTIGVKLLSVSRYETGVRFPGHETLKNFRKNIHVDTNWLLTGEGEMFTKEFVAKVDADFQKSLDWMIEFCRKVRKGEIEQTPEIEEILNSIAKITKLASDKGGSK